MLSVSKFAVFNGPGTEPATLRPKRLRVESYMPQKNLNRTPPNPKSTAVTTWPRSHPPLTFLVEFNAQVDVTAPWQVSDKLDGALAQLAALPRELHHVVDAHIARGARGKRA